MSNVLRNIPSVNELLDSPPLRTLVDRVSRNVVVTPESPVTVAPELQGFDTKLRSGGGFSVSYRTGQSSVEHVLAAVRGAGSVARVQTRCSTCNLREICLRVMEECRQESARPLEDEG